MNRVGISDFQFSEKCHFDCGGRFESIKYHVFHHLDRSYVHVEFDNELNSENGLTDLVEWALKLSKESLANKQ